MNAPDAPLVHDNRRFIAVVAAMFICGIAVAVVAGLAMMTARQADQRSIRTAQEQLAASQANLARADENLIASQIAACESRDKSRQDTRLVFLALLDIASQGDTEESPAATAFRQFIDEAYDPINCVWGSPDFNTDVDPPHLPPAGGVS